MTTTIALFGAAGNMGTRLSNTLSNESEYGMFHVEHSETSEAAKT